MNKAIKHYSSMFFLPSLKKSLLLLMLFCIGFIGFSYFLLFLSFEGLIYSLFLGLSLFSSTLILDYFICNYILRTDPIYILRRTLAVSIFCWLIWFIFLLLGLIFSLIFDPLIWLKLALLGFAAVLTFRFVIFLSTSSLGTIQSLVSSFIQPLANILILIGFWEKMFTSISFTFFPFLLIFSIISFFSAALFLFLIDQIGKKNYDVHAVPLFRAFMLNWVTGLNAPFEKFLEKLGKNALIEVMIMKFDSFKTKAAILVPFVHPGPFKNIESSLLPSQLKYEFEKKFNCDACVPLGILGHELDLASQTQNKKIIDSVIDASNFITTESVASPFVKINMENITASCQIFGKTALLSFTLAPETTEDLPQELGFFVRKEAKKLGMNCSIIINAHNSITDKKEMDISLITLKTIALKSMKKALSLPHYPFEIGIKTVFPSEFTLKDGLGPGGITSLVVNVAEQKTAYVVIDGNNMVSGLREEIISCLKSKGFHEAEIFTTDTHAVSAIVLGSRGYHPVGEVMDKNLLIKYVLDISRDAELSLEPCRCKCVKIQVPEVRVIGEERLHSLSNLVDLAIKKAKKLVIPIFGIEGLILVSFLAFFL